MWLRVTQNARQRIRQTSMFAGATTRNYPQGSLYSSGAQNSAANPSPGQNPGTVTPIYNPGTNQVGDPRTYSSGYWNLNSGAGIQGLIQAGNTNNISGPSVINLPTPAAVAQSAPNWILIGAVALLAYVLFKG